MKTPAPADLQRWSEEVARDPSSLAFLPLARAYRRMGQRAAALQLCVRGLEHYPTHAEAHSLLALLHLEAGERERAADEWSMVLRLDPNHFEALRGLGFCYLEQDHLSKARQTLERAALLRPTDPAVQEALRLLGTRQELAESAAAVLPEDPWSAPAAGEPAADAAEPWAETPASAAAAAAPAVAPTPAAPSGAPSAVPASERGALPDDPSELFAGLARGGPVLGALLLDEQGLVLAGRLDSSTGADAEALGAILGGAIGEAARTVAHLSLGAWRGILLESEHAVLHLAPAGGSAVVLLAAKVGAPAGWVLRTAAQATELAARYLEEYA